jgi:hypothetical protein
MLELGVCYNNAHVNQFWVTFLLIDLGMCTAAALESFPGHF